VLLALGRFLFFDAARGHWIPIAAIIAAALAMRYWPRIVAWMESRRR
jgi:hypothetical protein